MIELSSVRHLIFNNSNDSAVAPASILFYRKENDIEKIKKNTVKHISLKPNIFFKTFKLMIIEKYDVKEILQQYFIDNDWAWKVFVYGNVLDYYFIKRLKENYNTIKQICENNKFLLKRGLQKDSLNRQRLLVSDLVGLPFVNTQKKDLQNAFILFREKWTEQYVSICPPKDIFKAPILLSNKGVDRFFNIKSAISYCDAVFTDSLLGIKGYKDSDISILKSISAIWSSLISNYFITHTASSIGIEREQIHIKEKLDIPYNSSDHLVKLYTKIEKYSKEYYGLVDEVFNRNNKYALQKEIQNLNEEVINLYNLSNQEKSLVDYTNSVTIPLLKGNNVQSKKVIKKLPYQSNILNSYAQIFIDHFRKRFNSDGHFFEVEIIHSKHIILMKFKVVSEPSKFENSIEWNKKGNKELLKNITDLGFENLSDNLYLQKDIKGFEPDYFYIAKPNQYKSWHSALAYLDLLEFINELHKNSNI